jgi:hypothetical protein
MSEIFHSVRDPHTNYLLPSLLTGKVAFRSFRVKDFFDDLGGSHYVVSRVAQGFSTTYHGHSDNASATLERSHPWTRSAITTTTQ